MLPLGEGEWHVRPQVLSCVGFASGLVGGAGKLGAGMRISAQLSSAQLSLAQLSHRPIGLPTLLDLLSRFWTTPLLLRGPVAPAILHTAPHALTRGGGADLAPCPPNPLLPLPACQGGPTVHPHGGGGRPSGVLGCGPGPAAGCPNQAMFFGALPTWAESMLQQLPLGAWAGRPGTGGRGLCERMTCTFGSCKDRAPSLPVSQQLTAPRPVPCVQTRSFRPAWRPGARCSTRWGRAGQQKAARGCTAGRRPCSECRDVQLHQPLRQDALWAATCPPPVRLTPHPTSTAVFTTCIPLNTHTHTPQAIVNLYRPGEGISAHLDLARFEDGVVGVSLGGPAVMHFRRQGQGRDGDGGGGGAWLQQGGPSGYGSGRYGSSYSELQAQWAEQRALDAQWAAQQQQQKEQQKESQQKEQQEPCGGPCQADSTAESALDGGCDLHALAAGPGTCPGVGVAPGPGLGPSAAPSAPGQPPPQPLPSACGPLRSSGVWVAGADHVAVLLQGGDVYGMHGEARYGWTHGIERVEREVLGASAGGGGGPERGCEGGVAGTRATQDGVARGEGRQLVCGLRDKRTSGTVGPGAGTEGVGGTERSRACSTLGFGANGREGGGSPGGGASCGCAGLEVVRGVRISVTLRRLRPGIVLEVEGKGEGEHAAGG